MKIIVCMCLLCLLGVSAQVDPAKCEADIKQAGLDVAAAGASIGKAVLDCRSDAVKCATDVSDAVTSLGEASQVITQAVTDCGGTNNTKCAQDITAIATAVGKVSTVIESAVSDCKGGIFQSACITDIKDTLIDLVGIVGDIDGAISDCKSGTLTLMLNPDYVAFSRLMVEVEAASHYEDPSAGCEGDEVSVQITSVKGDFCTSACSLLKPCPTDVPAHVTAKPACALQDASQNKKYCALICDPSGANTCGEATCKPISGTGICTYDD